MFEYRWINEFSIWFFFLPARSTQLGDILTKEIKDDKSLLLSTLGYEIEIRGIQYTYMKEVN